MDTMVSYCGLICNTCPIHLATLEQNKSKQLSMRSEITRTFMEQYGLSIRIEDVTDCDGCRTGGRLFSGCAKCEIRRCAMERGLESCAFCLDYACENLQKLIEGEPGAGERLEELRRTRDGLNT